MAPTVTLRPATPADAGFLRALYASTREDELALLGWSPEQVDAFLDLQFRAREGHYRREHSAAEDCIVEAGGGAVGRLDVDRNGEAILVIDLALSPHWRGLGIGTRLLEGLIDEATAAGRSIELHVEAGNHARRLYERVGFVAVAEAPPYVRMRWEPPGSGAQPNTTS